MKRDIMDNKKNRGMTLVELLIVVAIVAILSSAALPSWNSQVQKARRADARNTLMLVQVEQEKYRADSGSYASSMSALGLSTYNSTSRDYYNISIVSSSETAFVASATPNTNGGQNNDLCGTFAVDQSGPNQSGVYASISDCW
jgi:type IV pilus assembly protein PilE